MMGKSAGLAPSNIFNATLAAYSPCSAVTRVIASMEKLAIIQDPRYAEENKKVEV